MGQQQSQSVEWRASTAVKLLPMYSRVFGKPYIMVNKAHGAAIWYEHTLKNKMLFGKPICFRKIMLVDDPKDMDNLFVFMDLEISDAKYTSMLPISKKFIYDRSRKTLMVKGTCITEVVVLSKLLTDVAVGKLSAETVTPSLIETTMVSARGNPGMKQELYMKLCDNLSKNKEPVETFSDTPYYAVNEPYASNQPLDIALQEGYDRNYYDILDQLWKEKKSSDSIYAFPRAPTGKASIENYLNMGQVEKMKERMEINPDCTGACLQRYKKIFGTSGERMINYDAYRGDYKSGSEIPSLAMFEKKTLQ